VERPYKFITFDTFIQKTKKLYTDTRANRNHIKMMCVSLACTHPIPISRERGEEGGGSV